MNSYFFTLEVFEDIKVYENIDGCEKLDDLSGSIYFSPGEILLSECGIEVAG